MRLQQQRKIQNLKKADSKGISNQHRKKYVLCLVTRLCPTLCDPMHCRPPGSSVHADSPGQNTGVGCHALLQGTFPTQRSTPGLPHCRQIFQRLSHQVSPEENITYAKRIEELLRLRMRNTIGKKLTIEWFDKSIGSLQKLINWPTFGKTDQEKKRQIINLQTKE